MNMATTSKPVSTEQSTRRAALIFVTLLGITSLFADMVYEGGRSISGPYLALLGASGTAVGVVAGLGELLGYTLRLITGYLSDRTRRYWALTIAGYTMTALVVPALALAGNWQLAALLLVLERIGKGIRSPSKDTLLSQATKVIGHGKGFGLHELLDQIGAVAAPLLLAAILAWRNDYRIAFAVLLIPAMLSIGVLFLARTHSPQTKDATSQPTRLTTMRFSRSFWWYIAAVGLIAAGYVDFPLIAFHIERASIAPAPWIPILYAVAMGVDAVTALIFGALFDRIGFVTLAVAGLLAAFFAPLAFAKSLPLVIAGMVLWGIGMGAQESVLRAAIAQMTPLERRGTAYGVFNTGYGLCWFAGSALLGVLYDVSLPALIGVSIGFQVLAVVFLVVLALNQPRPSSRI
jgi:MFS family permease